MKPKRHDGQLSPAHFELPARPVVFLDRDSTLIENNTSHGSMTAAGRTVEFAEGASLGCERLKRLGFALVMVTNQPDVARGTLDRRTVEIDNQHIAEFFGLDLALACMHDDLDRCSCRKPRPGLIYEAASILGLHLDRASVMIGDRWRDMEAGAAAGLTTILLDRGYMENLNTPPDHTVPNLLTAIDWIEDNLNMLRHDEDRRF